MIAAQQLARRAQARKSGIEASRPLQPVYAIAMLFSSGLLTNHSADTNATPLRLFRFHSCSTLLEIVHPQETFMRSARLRSSKRLKSFRNRFPDLFRTLFPLLVRRYGDQVFRLLVKIVTHDHWDCDNDAETVLVLLYLRGKFDVLPTAVRQHLNKIDSGQTLPTGKFETHTDALEFHTEIIKDDPDFQAALIEYRQSLIQEPGKVDLGQYVDIIAKNNIAVMQTEPEIRLFFKQRIERGLADSLAGLVWRGAPLSHCEEGLSGDDVVRIFSEEVDKAPFPVVLELIIMRHEARMDGYHNRAQEVADLSIAHPNHVGYLDFAADESMYHSRSDYRFYFVDAIRAWAIRLSMGTPLVIDCHMGETIPVEDWLSELLNAIESLLFRLAKNMKALLSNEQHELGLVEGLEALFGPFTEAERPRFIDAEKQICANIRRLGFDIDLAAGQAFFLTIFLGHGIHDLHSDRPRSVCVSSNLYLLPDKIGSINEHPIGQLVASGKRITLGPDGLDPLNIDDVSQDYALLWHSNFAFRIGHFKQITYTALELFNAPAAKIARLRQELEKFYGPQ
jgi:hypothetical protein